MSVDPRTKYPSNYTLYSPRPAAEICLHNYFFVTRLETYNLDLMAKVEHNLINVLDNAILTAKRSMLTLK